MADRADAGDADPQVLMAIAQAIIANTDWTMILGGAEIERAKAIKAAVEARRSSQAAQAQAHVPVNAVTDYEYAQYTLVCPAEEPMDQTLYRMSMLQAFKREFGITETVEQGMEMMEWGLRSMPGFLISLSELPGGNFVSVEDWSKFHPNMVQDEASFRLFLGWLYYISQAKNAHLMAVRIGILTVIECTGMTGNWRNDSSDETILLQRILDSFWQWYPRNFNDTYFMNSTALISEWCGTFKRYRPFGHPSKVRMDAQVPGNEGERLDTVYRNQLPDAQLARQELMEKFQTYLRTRYANESRFVLPMEE